MWSGAPLDLLRQEMPQTEATVDHFRPTLQSGFPWHHADHPHPEIETPNQWWDRLLPVFEDAFRGVGVEAARAPSLT